METDIKAENRNTNEKVLVPKSGWGFLFLQICLILLCIVGIILGIVGIKTETITLALFIPGILGLGLYLLIGQIIVWMGFRIIGPNESLVLLLFGNYYGTIKKPGYFFVNPFCKNFNPGAEATLPPNLKPEQAAAYLKANSKLSLKTMTLNNEKQKVNDLDGNPIEIGVIATWRIVNTAKAVFNVDNYLNYMNVQTDSAIRQVARLYPYDAEDGGDEKSLRGSSQEIAETLRKELQEKVEVAGIEIEDVRISHLAYAQEIAAAMLQRQQASAIVMARQKIVEGAVSMVEMALNKLKKDGIVDLDDERKAQMVSNLMVGSDPKLLKCFFPHSGMFKLSKWGQTPLKTRPLSKPAVCNKLPVSI